MTPFVAVGDEQVLFKDFDRRMDRFLAIMWRSFLGSVCITVIMARCVFGPGGVFDCSLRTCCCGEVRRYSCAAQCLSYLGLGHMSVDRQPYTCKPTTLDRTKVLGSAERLWCQS